jgi:NADH:ubiquinone oxidoreductase subunit 6 (subunit J)
VSEKSWFANDVKGLVSAALFLVLVFSAIDLTQVSRGGGVRINNGWDAAPTGAENPVGVANFVFGPYALPLIVLSIALLVALVGALVLAKPDPEVGER